MIRTIIELTGLAGAVAGTRSLELTLPEQSTYRDILPILAERYPGLVGILITADHKDFLSSNMFVVDGDLVNPVMLLDQSLRDGENLHLMSVITGG